MSVTTPKNIARYQVLKHLESGGMGSVFLARDPALDRMVAIKLLREGFDSPELRQRFTREARSAGRLRHINIVTVFDVGEHENQPFIAMEFVDGETLHAMISRRATLSIGRKLQLMEALCDALHYAHRAGVVHRDVKPNNIMIDSDGVLKVLDFGIARISDPDGVMSKTQAIMGTLNYMAPEQMMGDQDLDFRADMFAAGAVFYELLAYRQAFPGSLENGILYKIINTSPEPLEQIAPGLDPAVIAVVNRCLEKTREHRYDDMAAVRRELHAYRVRNFPPELDIADEMRGYLDDARDALSRGDFTVSLKASQRALQLDSNDPMALQFERQGRLGLENRQIDEWLTDARSELNRGALTAASLMVERALSLNSSSPEAAVLRALVDEARRQFAEKQALETALSRAREELAGGAFDAAFAHVEEALAIDPLDAVAKAIYHDIEAAVERWRRAEEARAQEAVEGARRQFAAHEYTAAITALERFTPPALVADALRALRLEHREIKRIEAKRKEEARAKAAVDAAKSQFAARDYVGAIAGLERFAPVALVAEALNALRLELRKIERIEAGRKEEARAKAAVDAARRQFEGGDYAGAIAGLERFSPFALIADGLSDLRLKLHEIQRIEAERQAEIRHQAEIQRQAAAEAAERLRKGTVRKLHDAAARLKKQDLDGARAILLEVLQQQPEHSDARALDAQIEQAIKLRDERRRRVTAGLATVRAHLQADAFEEARQALDEVEGLDVSAPDLPTLRRSVEDGIRAAETEARRRRIDKQLVAAADELEFRNLPKALEHVMRALSLDAVNAAAKALEAKVHAAMALEDLETSNPDTESGTRDLGKTVVLRPPPDIVRRLQDTVVIKDRGAAAESLPPGPVVTPIDPAPAPLPAPAVTTGQRRRTGSKLAVPLAVVTVAVVAAAAWMFSGVSSPAPAPAVRSGTLVIDIAPWAAIDSITNTANGKAAHVNCPATPCVVSLPAGVYDVRANNPNFPGAIAFEVRVAADSVREERRAVPGFSPEDEISSILNSKN